MKKISIALLLICSIALSAQNHGAQYISSDKNGSADSVKSEYVSKPSNSGFTETVISKKSKSGDAGNSNDAQTQNTDIAQKTNEPNSTDATVNSNGNTLSEYNSQTSTTSLTDCPERIGKLALTIGIISFILGLIIGYIVRNSRKEKQG